MTRKELIQLVNKSEAKFLRCWNVLESMKQYKLNMEEFPHFQPLLAETIYDLSAGYKKICKARDRLVLRKENYSYKWFARQQKLLADRQKVINEAISIGKALGDAFAWFFYQKDRHLLLEHAKHPPILQMPTGLGGIGEKEFIKNIRAVGPFMVLYHGTTSILRIGDISLIDLEKFTVAAIGEIKTGAVEEGKLNISLSFIGEKTNLQSFENAKPAKTPQKERQTKELPPFVLARLDRQMKKISKTITRKNNSKESGTIHKEEKRHVTEFEKLTSCAKVGRFTYGQLGRGLLCTIYKNRSSTLSSKLIPRKKIDFGLKMDLLVENTIPILLENSPHNSFMTSSLAYTHDGQTHLMPGTIPIFWWPMRLDVLRALIFHDIIAITIYNPAHFFHTLESKGYKIDIRNSNNTPKLIQKIGETNIEVTGLPYFLRLIHHDMFDEEQIIEMIEDFVKTVRGRQYNGPERHEIIFNHVIFKDFRSA